MVAFSAGGTPDTLARMIGPRMSELIALAQAQPRKILFGSAGAGSATHMNGERFRLAAGIKAVHVGFKGQPEAAIEVLAGRVHYAVLNLAVVLPMIKDEKLLALAVSSPQRSSPLPGVPTMAETLPELKRPEGGWGYSRQPRRRIPS